MLYWSSLHLLLAKKKKKNRWDISSFFIFLSFYKNKTDTQPCSDWILFTWEYKLGKNFLFDFSIWHLINSQWVCSPLDSGRARYQRNLQSALTLLFYAMFLFIIKQRRLSKKTEGKEEQGSDRRRSKTSADLTAVSSQKLPFDQNKNIKKYNVRARAHTHSCSPSNGAI